MTQEEEKPHKLQIWITPALFIRMGKVFPHGTKQLVFTELAEQVTGLMETTEKPEQIAGAIMAKELRLEMRDKNDQT